jgi:hypothetical protein
MAIDEYYFYACEYMAKTELYDRTLTNERSPFDSTSALLSNGRLRRISYEYCLKLRKYFTEICGGTFGFIREEINKHGYYTAQMWIDEYFRLKEIYEDGDDEKTSN